MTSIGERIHLIRIKRNLTLEEVAKRINVSRQTVQRYESNVIKNIPSEKINLISQVLNVSPHYLMGWTDIQIPSDTNINEPQTLIDILNSKDKETQDLIVEILSILSQPKFNIQQLNTLKNFLRTL